MANATAVLIRTNGDVESVTLPEENAYTVIQEMVGGLFDCVNGDDFAMYVHDEGLLIDLDPNIVASLITGRVIAGDVVVVGSLNANGYHDGENYDAPSRFFTSDFAKTALMASESEGAIAHWHKVKKDILDAGPIVMPLDEWLQEQS